MSGEQKGAPSHLPKISHTSYNDETWHSCTLPKEYLKKHINHFAQRLSSADISIFPPEIKNFCYIKKYRYRLHVNVFKVLVNMVTILMMSPKVATLAPLKIWFIHKNT